MKFQNSVRHPTNDDQTWRILTGLGSMMTGILHVRPDIAHVRPAKSFVRRNPGKSGQTFEDDERSFQIPVITKKRRDKPVKLRRTLLKSGQTFRLAVLIAGIPTKLAPLPAGNSEISTDRLESVHLYRTYGRGMIDDTR